MTDTEALIRRLYADFNRRDIPAVMEHLSPDVDWANGMDGGHVHGREAVRAYWTKQWAAIEPKVDPLRITQRDESVFAVEVHQVVRDLQGQLLLDEKVRHVFRVEQGLIARFDIEQAGGLSSIPPRLTAALETAADCGRCSCAYAGLGLERKSVSVAFTREEDYEAQAANLPDRPVSTHPNLVTQAGLQAIENALGEARAAYAAAQGAGGVSADRTAMARATRDLRYWSARRASAQLTEPAPIAGQVQFGRTVRIVRDDGREQTFSIVGEDQADPTAGRLSYVSPLARALLGRSEGDVVSVAGAEAEILQVV